MKLLRISILGTRGIPARYGGFETCAEEIATRLVKRGHKVTVYAKAGSSTGEQKRETEYKGVKIVHLPRFSNRYFDFSYYITLSTILAACSTSDILHYFGCGRVPFTVLGRMLGKTVVLTLDGLEWERSSYPPLSRIVMRSYAELAMVLPNATVVDSLRTQKWYVARTGRVPIFIPYGTAISTESDKSVLEKYGLEEGKYILFVGRLVHEKGAHTLIEAFKSVRTDMKLVIVGDFPATSEYVRSLKEMADERTVFLGFVYGREFEVLRNGSLVYVHPSLFDGTSISLLGALGAGRCVLSSDLQDNKEVGGDSVSYFKMGDVDDLRERLQALLDDPGKIKSNCGKSLSRASALFDWDKITDSYEDVYIHSLDTRKRKQ